MLINTNDVPDAMPTINNVPEMACDGVVLVVGGPPSDDAGWPVGGASTFQFPQHDVIIQFVYFPLIYLFVQYFLFVCRSHSESEAFGFDLFIYFEISFK